VSSSGGKLARWLCVCNCGSKITVIGNNLRRGSHKSCGCYKSEAIRRFQQLPKGQASFNALYKDYKKKAIAREYAWELSKEDFKKITSSNCYYCYVEPSQVYGNGQKYNGLYTYNGIDRLYNDKGYTLENSVPCCGECNIEKGRITPELVLRLYDVYFGGK
jgi:hypothetical protein